MVAAYNLPWNAPKESEKMSQHIQFKKAMKVTEKSFISKLFQEIMVVLPARALVFASWEKRQKFHHSKMFL
jgi:hypothetical protein